MKNNTKINLQGGDIKMNPKFYEFPCSFIKQGALILNLGCGSQFIFEQELVKHVPCKIWSCDIVPTKKPSYVDNFFLQSVEEEFTLDKKFDVITFFELIEHIDKTDVLLKNCFNNLKKGGLLIFSFPNLSSIYSRLELLLGFQPHILEVSNEHGSFGTGIFGRYNGSRGGSIHHIRGITFKAMTEMVTFYGFNVEKVLGYGHRFGKIFRTIPSLAPNNFFICKKK